VKEAGRQAVVAHLDHGLRPESPLDQAFVRALAERLGFPFFTERVEVARIAQARGENLEAVAREVRYAFLHRVAREVGARAILTAHTLDDQAETVLLQLLQGTARATGIREREGIVVRPLLAHTREELRALEEAERKRAERERAFQEALKRLKEESPAPEDRPLLAEVEALARGERKESPVLRALNLPETPEAAHAFLLRLGLWQRENPHPRRLGLPLQPPDLPAPPLPEEDRVDLTHLPAFAIDDEGSQDPDDAVFAEKVEGGFRLFVHVADVAALVPPKSPLDEEALLPLVERCLARGQRARALAHLERYRRRLWEELGERPSPEVEALLRELGG
jgi:tRNA(Ile)-lysidine synthetase-like protein